MIFEKIICGLEIFVKQGHFLFYLGMWHTYTFGDNSGVAAAVIDPVLPPSLPPKKQKRKTNTEKWDSSSDSTVILDTPR